ncbi:basic salivary proline-rich protein 1-like [Lagopus muta]|uniref:basic salivary proline-rich protein 1-like n=1 Tax=Lagopus muta TaxID=64668 RepID=UPI0020A09185|nr:basic salivary proline-rich protein 1-like [Lagopus muta]
MYRRTSRTSRVCSLGSIVSLGLQNCRCVFAQWVREGFHHHLGGVFAFSDVARAVEVPHENPSSPAPGFFTAELPDNPEDSTELSTQAASGTPTDPFWGLPPSPGFLSELQCGLSELHPVVQTASARLSPRPTTLSVHLPQRKAHSPPRRCSKGGPRRLRQRRRTGAVPSGGPSALRLPAPPRKGRAPSRSSPPAALRPRKGSCHHAGNKREGKSRKQPWQAELSGAGAGASGSQAGTVSELRAHLQECIQAVHPLGQRVTAVDPLRQPPSVQPQPSASAGPAALQPQGSDTNKAVPAAPGSTVQEEGTAKQAPPSCPRLSPQRSSALRRDPLQPPPPPALHQQQPRHPVDFVPCVGPQAGGGAIPTVMEELLPITAEQWPQRESMKKPAQEEQQQVAQQMKICPVQFLEQQEIDMAIANQYSYP